MAVDAELLTGRYALAEQLGYGGMGRVYRAHDRVLDRDVAIKFLDELDRSIEDDARAVAQLSHPGIVRVFDTGRCERGGFLVMELVNGPSLKQALAERGRFEVQEGLRLAAQVADALEHAHSQGLIHCNLKPHNILLDGQRPKLVDFGIAQGATISGTLASDEIRGSAPYLAPEQATGQRPDARTDVYGLGATLYELLTGRPPFEGQSLAEILARHLTSEPAPPSELNPSPSSGLDQLVLTALARDPDARFQTASAFRDAISEATTPASQTVRIARSLVGPDTSSARPRRWVFPLVLAVLLGIGLIQAAVGFGRGAPASQPVPSLAGTRLSQVPAALENAHLSIGQVTAQPVDPARVGTVVDQRPPPGERLPAGGKVDLVIGVSQ